MASLPMTSNLPPLASLTATLWNVACGNRLASNHAALATSASSSATPNEALATSMVTSILLASGFLGSKAIRAAKFLNLPFTGTPICALVNEISLCAATNICWAEAGMAEVRIKVQATPHGKNFMSIDPWDEARTTFVTKGRRGR